MAELDQQMMMEHRMKKKTLNFYHKLFEASKAPKGRSKQTNFDHVYDQTSESMEARQVARIDMACHLD